MNHPNPSSPSARSGLVVVIEDEDMVLVGYQMLLEGAGYDVLAGPSVDSVLAQWRPGITPVCVLADYRLGGGRTGTEAIATIRELCQCPVPGLVVTGDMGLDRLRLAAAAGIPVLHKPLQGRDLLEAIQRSAAVCRDSSNSMRRRNSIT